MTASVADPKTWSISSGTLPPGLAIDASTGLISGTPTAAGQFDFQVLAKVNSDTRSDTKVLAIVVRDQLGILGAEPFTTARRAIGEVSVPFDATLTATGGSGTYAWSLTSGALPPGLILEEGAISGTPTTAGVYAFTATLTDSEGRVANYPATHRRRAEARRLDAAPPSRTAGGLLPGEAQDHRRRRCRERGESSAARSLVDFASTAPPACSSGSRRARAAIA